MRFLLCMLGIFLLVEQIYCEEEPWKKIINECKKEFPIPENPEENDPKVKCFTACIMEKYGLLNENGKLDEARFAESLRTFYPDADNTFESKVKECANKGNAEGDKCEVVYVARTCVEGQFGKPKNQNK